MVGLVAGALADAPVGAQESPSLTVTPSSGLVDGQHVTVTGTGFLPNTSIFVLMCPPGVTIGFDCDISNYSNVTSDSIGAITTDLVIRRFITGAGTPGEFDCSVVECTVAAGDINQIRTAFAAVDLIDQPPLVPEIATAPARADGVVDVTGSGFRPGRTYDLRQCPPGAATLASCDLLIQRIGTDGDGTVTAEIYPRADAVAVEAGAPVLHDCSVVTCTLHVVDAASTTVASAPLDLSALPASIATLTADPLTDLTDSTAVELTGTGYPSDLGGPQVRQCAVADSTIACPVFAQFGDIPDGNDLVSFTALVRRDVFVDTGPGFVDCVTSPCVLLSEESQPGTFVRRRRIFPLSFAPAPHPPVDPVVTVTHHGGDSYTVSGNGFPLGGEFIVIVCGVDPGSSCGGGLPTAVPDSTGTFSLEAAIPRFPNGTTNPDCLLGCYLLLLDLQGDPYATSEAFSSPAPILTVTLDTAGTLDPGTEDVVVSATITCDQPTRVQVDGTVSQPGVTGGYSFTDQCSPDEPLLAFIPTRDVPPHVNDFVLGPADASVSAESVDGPATAPVTATGTVTLYDEDVIVAIVGPALADPANVELREQFVRAVAARLRQDPVFAAELYQAIFGGG